MPKMMGKARWWGAWSFNGDDYNAGQRAAEKREWQAEAKREALVSGAAGTRESQWQAYCEDLGVEGSV